jgi:hypothetical protein
MPELSASVEELPLALGQMFWAARNDDHGT